MCVRSVFFSHPHICGFVFGYSFLILVRTLLSTRPGLFFSLNEQKAFLLRRFWRGGKHVGNFGEGVEDSKMIGREKSRFFSELLLSLFGISARCPGRVFWGVNTKSNERDQLETKTDSPVPL